MRPPSGGVEARFVEPGNFASVLGPETRLRWTLGSGSRRALLVVWDDAGKEVLRTEVDGDNYTIAADAPGLTPGADYYAEASPAGARAPTARCDFHILSKEEATAVRQAEAAAREVAVGGTGDPSSLMLLMVTYIENRLYNQAIALSDELELLVTNKTSLLRLRAHAHAHVHAHAHAHMALLDLAEKDLARAERLASR